MVRRIERAYVEAIYKEIGFSIRTVRRASGMTQAELGTILGLTRITIANMETGAQRIHLHHVYAIAEAFDVDPKDLLP